MVRTEELLTLLEAKKLLPRPVSICTVRRWYLRGIGGVRLDTVLVGGRRFTSREAIDRFITATTSAASTKEKQPALQDELFDNDHAVTTRRGIAATATESSPPGRSDSARRTRSYPWLGGPKHQH